MANEQNHQKPNLEMFWEEISILAEKIYKKRVESNEHGSQLTDWLQAEIEVKKKYKM
jgi:hypothetical protein